MKAAVMHGVNNIVVEEFPSPVPKAGELLIRVKSTRVCGTDVGMYHGKHPGAFLPRILGHECAGEVVKVGEGIEGFAPGDRISVDPLIYCGRCYFCRIGKNNLCENGGLMGRETNGSFAEYAIITPERLRKIPPAMSFDVAAYMDAVGSVYHAQRMSRLLGPGASVVVLGLGSIGMLHVQLAKLAGANPIIGVGRSPWKLELSRKFGADIVIDASKEDAIKALLKMTPHHGADVVIEAAGAPDTIRQSYEMVRPGGEIIQYGIGPTSVDGINNYLMYYKEFTVYGVRALTHNDFSISANLLEQGLIQIEPLITHRFPIENTAKGLDIIEQPVGKVLGVIINS